MNSGLKLYMIAGELSGDRLGADLIADLRKLINLETMGVGGPQMKAQGLKSLFDMSDLSVMGLFEILPRVPKLLSRVRQTAQSIIDAKPDAIVTIDSPDFCFRVLSKVKEQLPDCPVIHYVAPSVWAWRPKRAAKMAKFVDHVLALLPFEQPYMIEAGMSCDFVGHPVAFQNELTNEAETDFRSSLPASFTSGPLITLLPGSRRGELRRMAPIFNSSISIVLESEPETNFILPVANGLEEEVRNKFARFEKRIFFLSARDSSAVTEEWKRIAYRISDVALATSGTVALELAGEGCPMVVAYKANWATTRMVKKLAQIDTANLVNIVTNTRGVPEFLFDKCEPELIARAMLRMIEEKSASDEQRALQRQTMQELGRGNPKMEMAAARSVLKFLKA